MALAGPGPSRGECASGLSGRGSAARSPARAGPGKRAAGPGPGCSLAGIWPGPGHWSWECCGPVRRRGLVELADDVVVVDVVVVAVAADARLVRLTIDDAIDHNGQVFIRLGDPAPAPEPFAAMLTELAANRATMNTAAKPASLWLFPGGHAGQPLPMARSSSSSAATQTRTAAFRQLLLHARPSRRHALD